MIKLNRPQEPSVLKAKSAAWTTALMDAIKNFGSYDKIPVSTKDKLLAHYRHDEIKSALTESSHGKCAFCECIPSEGGYLNIEHFKPKARYPDSAFEWKNLLPSCAPCNGSKLNHDTEAEPIINPYEIDPAGIFYYDGISMKAKNGPHQELAIKTIEICSLESIRLWRPRADILLDLTIFTKALADAIDDFSAADTEKKEANRVRKIEEAIRTIESLTHPSSKFSAFCQDYLNKCNIYQDAKLLVSNYNALIPK